MQNQIPGYLERDVIDFNGLFSNANLQLSFLQSLALLFKKLKPGNTKLGITCRA